MKRWAWIVAGSTVVFHLATSTIYSYHRDEVYYLASGRRLSWGYVDHPPLTPFLYRVSDTLFGSSLFGLRILPALLHGALDTPMPAVLWPDQTLEGILASAEALP